MTSLPVSAHSASAKGPSWSLKNARLVSVSRGSWAAARATSRGWEWPKFSAE